MTKIFNAVAFFAAAFLSSGSAFAAGGAVADEFKWMTFAVFGVIIAITMAITFWAARTTHTTSEFYAAGRSVSGDRSASLVGMNVPSVRFAGLKNAFATRTTSAVVTFSTPVR